MRISTLLDYNDRGGMAWPGLWSDRQSASGAVNLLAGLQPMDSCRAALSNGIGKTNQTCREHDIPAATFDFSLSGLMVTFTANPAHLSVKDDGATTQATPQVATQVGQALTAAGEPVARDTLQQAMGIADREHFRRALLSPTDGS